MARHRDFQPNDPWPSGAMDTVYDFLSTYASPNFNIVRASATSVQVQASAAPTPGTVGPVAIAIGGSLRFNTANVSASASGAEGFRTIWATAGALNEAQEDGGTFNYSFALEITTGGAPATALYRPIGFAYWTGTKLSYIIPMFSPTPYFDAREVQGHVTAAGVGTGFGFTASRLGTGQYMLDFHTGGAGTGRMHHVVPVPYVGSSDARFCTVESGATPGGAAVVYTWSHVTGAKVDTAFLFTARPDVLISI